MDFSDPYHIANETIGSDTLLDGPISESLRQISSQNFERHATQLNNERLNDSIKVSDVSHHSAEGASWIPEKHAVSDPTHEFRDCYCIFSGALNPISALGVINGSFFYGSYDGKIRAFDMEQGRKTKSYAGHTSWVSGMNILPHRNTMLSTSRDGTLRKWNFDLCEEKFSVLAHSGGVNALDVVETEGEDDDVWESEYDVSKISPAKKLKSQQQQQRDEYQVDENEETQTLKPLKVVTGGDDKMVRLWNKKGEPLIEIEAHSAPISNVSFNEGKILSSSWDGSLRVVDVEQGQEVFNIIESDPINCFHIDSSNNRIYVGSSQSVVRLYDLRSGTKERSFVGHVDGIMNILYHEEYLFSSSEDRSIRQWDIVSGACVYTYRGHGDGVRCLAQGTDGHLYSGSMDKTVRCWNVEAVTQRVKEEEERRKEETKEAEKNTKGRKKKKKGKKGKTKGSTKKSKKKK
eukprot:gb/GECH01008917.1/.p1 GENE.gb/GECH01008917.1/~~gb/GECH01008917.1/.p1  ORF type:complete len:461 (+),score=80.09 gb/GECH01008917.1/:1-1383(+)